MTRIPFRLSLTKRQVIELGLMLALLIVLLVIGPLLGLDIGRSEFRFNWTAGYLLAHGNNMYDPDLVLQVERSLTGIFVDFPFITLSPPWGVVFFLPYALFPFDQASWYWLLTNVFLGGLSGILLWRNAVSAHAHLSRYWWIGLLITFSFSITLTTIFIGQTTIWVLGMLTLFLVFEKQGWDEWAGVFLAGTLVKPQMVFATLVLLAIFIWRAKRWRIVWGFVGALVIVFALLFAIRWTWLPEYWDALTQVRALDWESSNLGGLLLVLCGRTDFKFIGVVMLPLVAWLGWRNDVGREMRTFVDGSVLFSVIMAPYGFSYDFVILLIPLLRIAAWMVEGVLQRRESIVLALILLFANILIYIERVLTPSEVYFFWVPLVIAGAYAYGLWRSKRQIECR